MLRPFAFVKFMRNQIVYARDSPVQIFALFCQVRFQVT